MGDLTRNLSRHEFACRCGCGLDTVDVALPGLMQEGCDHFQAKYPHMKLRIMVNRGGSCAKHNKTVGGTQEKRTWLGQIIPGSGSQHLYFKAADFYFEDSLTGYNIPSQEVYDYYNSRYPERLGIGLYNGRIHLDTRFLRARWNSK